ncbi:methyltransferase domain-containing protein [Ramlibacter terrae]|uniref:Methyltransferase domain-containing protein n=1 Tax=Ramlibacter terrae TaxID=2732511 RepID=A0ABX6P4P1_9BURK|nr:methyltransferase domain-containing protein [Ramlibacter terrae]
MSRDPLWEDIFASRPRGKYPPEEFIRFVAGNFYRAEPRHAVKLMEVGFGTGANLWYAAREGFSVYGPEGAQAGCDRAMRRLDEEVPGWRDHGAELRVGDICEPLPYADASFDAVLDSDAVTCNSFEEARKVYAEMHRVTRPGGLLYVRTPATGCWGEGTGEAHGHGAWRCAEGPFAGTGIVRFTSEADLPSLLGPRKPLQVEQVSRTLENRTRAVTEWVIVARRDDA